MFSVIAKNYDKANSILSLGNDNLWRTYAAKECLKIGKNIKVLDVATGTGKLAFSIAKIAKNRGVRVSITGIDFNEDMLSLAKRKLKGADKEIIEFVIGDALSIKYKDCAFNVVTSGFALRNFDNLQNFINEAHRVLKPGGRLVLLDMAKPEAGLLNGIMRFYYFNIIPLIGAHYYKNAYIHLVNTVWEFNKEDLIKKVRHAGFKKIRIKNLTLGAAFVLTAKK
jgi:demethylmenaquinone methyltransferase/2-methoxy-6-polyprenyl-1,4-benzoquinol methylase